MLRGEGLFTDDVQLPDMAHAAFVRSPYAHAKILSIDTSEAEALDGVIAIYTAESLGDYWQPGPLLVPPPPVAGTIFNQRTQVPLAKDKVRHVGEPVVLIIANSRYIAEDAADIDSVDDDSAEINIEKLVAKIESGEGDADAHRK